MGTTTFRFKVAAAASLAVILAGVVRSTDIIGAQTASRALPTEARAPAEFDAWLASTKVGTTDGTRLASPGLTVASGEGAP